MTDQTISLNRRQLNQSIQTRNRADDNHLRKQKVDLEAERKYSRQQLDMKQRVLQDKLNKLRLRQRACAAFQSKPGITGISIDSKLDVSTSEERSLLQPIDNVTNPYPVTFDTTGKKNSFKNPRQKDLVQFPKFPKIPSNHSTDITYTPANMIRKWKRKTRALNSPDNNHF